MDDQQPTAPSNGAVPPPPLPPPHPAAAASSTEPVAVSLPGGPPSPWAPGTAGGEVPPGWSQTDPTYVATAAARPRKPRRLAAAVAAVVLVAGGLGATAAVMNKQQATGAQPTPEAAVQRFFEAIEDRDLLGAAETLLPAERALMVDLLADWRDSGVSGVPTDQDLSSFEAYTLTLDDVTTVTQPVTDDIAVVELTGGRFTASTDATKLPFGIGELAGDLAGAIDTDDDGQPDVEQATVSGDIAESDDPLRLATVRDADGWHVSLLYTIAEAARLEAGLQAPDPAERIADKGAASPDAAVREMVDAGARGDWRRMIELTSPGELGVLHDYGALLLEDAPPPPAEPWFTVTEMAFDRTSARNATILTVKTIAGTATVDGRTGTLRAEQVSEGCFHIQASVEGEEPIDERGCAADGFGQAGNEELAPELREQFDKLKELAEEIGGIAVVEVDGLWYVSPIRTVGRLFPAVMIGIQTIAGGLQASIGGGIDEPFPVDGDDEFCVADTDVDSGTECEAMPAD